MGEISRRRVPKSAEEIKPCLGDVIGILMPLRSPKDEHNLRMVLDLAAVVV